MSRAGRLIAGGLGIAALWASACSSEDTTTVAGPSGPASLQIDGFQPSGGPHAESDASCVELGRDAKQTIGVEVVAGNWTLRPPGACGSTPQCGTIVLTVDPESSSPTVVRGAAAFLAVPMANVAAPVGSHVFHVALVNDDGTTFVDKKTKQSLEAEVTIAVTAPGDCGGTPLDGGNDAASDASDAAADATSDITNDVTNDASDAASDAEAGGDASVDAGADAADDATDAATDAAADTVTDAANDAENDVATDSTADSTADAPAD